MDKTNYRSLANEAWEEAKLAVEILERARCNGEIPVNIDEIKRDVVGRFPQCDIGKLERAMAVMGRREIWQEAIDYFRYAFERSNQKYS